MKDNKMNKKTLFLTAAILIFSMFLGLDKTALSQNQPKSQPKAKTSVTKTISATPLNIVNSPDKYLDKTVKVQATFDKFSTLGLDYKKALRPSSEYIGILIQRDDITDHNIPLSEMKLFMKKDLAEKHIDLETGDKIEITAHMFSNALGDPWLDIEQLSIVKKSKKEENKN